MLHSLKIKLSLPIVLPLFDVIREQAAANEASRPTGKIKTDLRTLLKIFPREVPDDGTFTIREYEYSPTLRACSYLRLAIRATKLAGIPDATLQALPETDSSPGGGDEKTALLCFQFLAAIQTSILDHSSPSTSVFPTGSRAISVFSKLQRMLSSTRQGGSHPSRSSTGSADAPESANVGEVVVIDDPVNLMAYVTRVFQNELGLPREVAQQYMREVHERGASHVWSGPRQEAEQYVSALRSWHLNAALRAKNFLSTPARR